MISSSPSASVSSDCFDSSYCKHSTLESADSTKPVVTSWLQTIREQLDIERKVDINHYSYVKSLREPNISLDDCLYYSECEHYDSFLSQKSHQEIVQRAYSDNLLTCDLKKKVDSFITSNYFSPTKHKVKDAPECFQLPDDSMEINHICENKPIIPADECLYVENDSGVLSDVEQSDHNCELLNASDHVLTSDKSKSSERPYGKNKANTSDRCIGQVVIRVNELGNLSNRVFLNLVLDKELLELCKHIGTLQTTNNEKMTLVDNASLSSAISIEMTLPTQESEDIHIDIPVDQTESDPESHNSTYLSAVDLEDRAHICADLEESKALQNATEKNKTWIKQPRPKSLIENREDVPDNKKLNRLNRPSSEYSVSTPFFFPRSTFLGDEHFMFGSEDHLCHIETTCIEQTVGLPGFDEHGQNATPYQEDATQLPYSSPEALSSEGASYESLSSNDSIYHSDFNTLDSRMMDITSHTFETLLYIPRQRYNQVEDSLSDVTCSHFSSMEDISSYIHRGHMKQKMEEGALSGQDSCDKDSYLLKDSEDSDSVSSDVVQWMKDICFETLNDSDEDWTSEWFSSNDIEGRVYFFEENSSESSWTLPDVRPTHHDVSGLARSVSQDLNSNVAHTRQKPPPGDRNLRNAKAKSMILIDPTKKPPVAGPPPLTPISKHWPQLWDGHMCVLREGTLARTKITEHGKRLKKNWATSHVVLTELFLLFFKDAKQFHAMKTGGCVGRPELCVDLNGALIDRGDKMSSRRHVFLISTVLTLQVLIQFESSTHADSWLLAIHNAIKNLPSGVDNCSRIFKNPSIASNPDSVATDSKKSKICRSKSVKLKKEGSLEDLPASSAERQTKIKARLKKFFNRRPTMDHLVKKGIYKDEPAFGCYLEKVCPSESPRVPLFVQKCIQCIEKSEDNMKTDGLYRASGNLSQVQKIRLQVDQNNLTVLDEEEDVHVLAGALKLFFRELKEPLIPYQAFNKALKASTNHNRKEKLLLFRDIIRSLPSPNHDTFKFLLQHLLRVTRYKDFNRMHIPNLAIVFGPTLMWSEQESKNMALDFMQQNLVIECFLVEFDHVFR